MERNHNQELDDMGHLAHSTTGLNVVHHSSIFFKALANFQWDRLLNNDIIAKEYLEGCYKLGWQFRTCAPESS